MNKQPLYKSKQKRKATNLITNLPESGHIPSPVEWQEEFRYLPPEVSPENYGQFDRYTAPHLIEPLNRLHPDDPCTHLAIMKSVQSAGTVTVIEGGMGFSAQYKLGSSLFLTSNKGIGKVRSSSAIDPLIDNSGLYKLLKPTSTRMKNKTADTTFYKEFAGGIKWLITSYRSIGDMKSNTFQYVFCDEWDEAGAELADQGDIAGILEGRTMGVHFFKMIYISTPSRMETSRIYKAFIDGDQCRFFVPCPLCGEPQILELKGMGLKYGLTFNRKKDPGTGAKILDNESVRYICKHCGREWYESSKLDMMIKAVKEYGGWRPTWQDSEYTPKSPNHKSYHAQGLLSPFLPWSRICQQFMNTKFGEDLLLFKDFTINYLGNPWARIESSKSWKDIKSRSEDYIRGEVPEGGLRLYGGCDVQGDRLEIIIIALGVGMEKWIVDYQIFYGDPTDQGNPCWQALHKFAYKTTYKIRDRPIHISKIAIDCGFNPKNRRPKDWDSKAHTVFQFVAPRQDLFIAVRGAGEMQGSFDIIKAMRINQDRGGFQLTKRYDVNTHVIKEMILRHIDELAGPQAIHFPKYTILDGVKLEIADEFYRGFLSERYQEIKPGIMGWHAFYTRNEPWDTTIYAIAAMYLENAQTWDDDWWHNYMVGLTQNC